MNIETFQKELFQAGKEAGFTDMELFYSSTSSISISVYHQEIDEYTIMEEGGVSFRGLHEGKMGYAYTERIASDSIPLLVKEAADNAEITEAPDQEELFEGSPEYAEPAAFPEELSLLTPEPMIEAAKLMERKAYELDERVSVVQSSGVTKTVSELMIANTKGLHRHAKTAVASGGMYLSAQEGESTATGGYSDFTYKDFAEIDFEKIAETAVKEAVSKLQADSLASGTYPVIFRYDAATELIGSFLGQLSAESVQQGYSKWAGKIGETVAGKNITFTDDPLQKDALTYSTFDSEGHATMTKDLIKEGKLLSFLHNRKTAKKDGTVSTGNAMKRGFRGSIGIGPFNLYLQPGEKTLDEMIASSDRAILIVELHGTNAGINFTSGDFSLGVIGFLIEDGEIVRPLDQMTIAGNFFDILHEVEEIGNDLEIRSAVTIPSIKVKGLSVSGNGTY